MIKISDTNMERKTTSLRIDYGVWKAARMYCLENDTDLSHYIEDLIKKDLKK